MTANRYCVLTFIAVILLAAVAIYGVPRAARAQSPSSLTDEQLLSLVLPPLADGSRPGVHLWARADQSAGPSGLPTVFVVTLWTKQAASGPEEHEVINYVQYSDGGWAPARPRDDGTLLIDDWAWISLNLKNLTAVATGQGAASQYIVDYMASGNYGGSPRELSLEEIYSSDLSLKSSVVLSDTGGSATTPASTATATTVPSQQSNITAPNAITTSPPITAPAASPAAVVVPPTATPA